MIPYFEWRTIEIGPVTLYVWGLFVALGFLFGAFVAARYAKSRGLEVKIMLDLAFWMMLAGMIGGRIGHVLFYDFPAFAADPLSFFRPWEGGFSIIGGFMACIATALIFFRKRNVDVWKYADAAVFGLPFGMWIGRIGCFLIHDHPGTATNFFLGIEYPDGVVRHDHGLYESINAFLMAIVFLWMAKRRAPLGMFAAVFSVWYGAVRFFLDFFRAVDIKYAGLTPAQYFCTALFAFGVAMLVRINRLNK